MHPEEERPAHGPLLQPVEGRRADRSGGIAVPARLRIVVPGKPLLEPLPGAQEQVRHEGGGLVTLVRENLRQGQVGGGQFREQTARAMRLRVAAGQQGGHRLRGPGQGRAGPFEQRSLRRQAIDVGGRRPGVTVASETVRAKRVDRDQQDAGRLAASTAGGKEERGRDHDSVTDHPRAL